jgi:hypothetical protein
MKPTDSAELHDPSVRLLWRPQPLFRSAKQKTHNPGLFFCNQLECCNLGAKVGLCHQQLYDVHYTRCNINVSSPLPASMKPPCIQHAIVIRPSLIHIYISS